MSRAPSHSLAAMTTPQPGIFALGTSAHAHLFFSVADLDAVAASVGEIFEAMTTVRGVNAVVGFSPSLAHRISADLQRGVSDFESIGANGVELPADQHDMWLWLHGGTPAGCFDAATEAVSILAPGASLADQHQGFAYGASQDLTGFEDGTENPPLTEAVDVVRGEDGAGSTVALFQRWVHDLDAVRAMDLAARESMIGRTLDGSVELDPPEKTDRSHVSRVVIEEDGEELEMFRRSVPFGDIAEHGLLFVGFSGEPTRMQRMLENMAGVHDGITDNLTDISNCTGSGWYVVPSLEVLASLSPDD